MLKTTDLSKIKTYVGYTNNLKNRLTKHNSNKGAGFIEKNGAQWLIRLPGQVETLKQISEIENEGCDIVRVSIPDEASSKALKSIIPHMKIPLIADIHFHYKRALEAAENGAHCLRINPGNIGY